MAKQLDEITAHIRAVCGNRNVKTTLIQTEDLLLLCDAAEIPTGGISSVPIAPSQFVLGCLEANPEWKVQRFEYYAAHFLVGSGLIAGNLDGNIRALAETIKKQYDLGVVHGAEAKDFTPA